MSDWTDEQLRAAWLKTTPIAGSTDRIDCDGRRLSIDGHGGQWHVDHIIEKARGGTDHPSNLRARHKDGNCWAGGILGTFMRDEPKGILGAFTPPPGPRNAMLELARKYADQPRENAMVKALLDLPPLPPYRR